jgi:SAM-dependent methyltransferase
MAQIREHYEIERELAARLRGSSKAERRHLYASVYDELFQRVPLHPQLTRKSSAAETEAAVSSQMRFLGPLLSTDTTFLELGPGDCALSFEVAKFVKQVYAVDVSDSITKTSARWPENVELILSDGCSVPVPRNSVDIAYSHHLIEHLHPDDALEQVENVYEALTGHGIYICVTPNGVTGPHDVSRYFDSAATGLHLKEYSVADLRALFRRVGFSRVKVCVNVLGRYRMAPTLPFIVFEQLLRLLPHKLRKALAERPPVSVLLIPRVVGVK